MIHAIWQTVQKVFKDLFAAGGFLVSAIGAVQTYLAKHSFCRPGCGGHSE